MGATLNYNQWYHVAATLDGVSGTMSIYTNGTLAAQTVTAIRPFGTLIAGDSPGVGIGNLNDGGNNFPFIGDIDEISLYNRALTGVRSAKTSTTPAARASVRRIRRPRRRRVRSAPAGLVSWWRGENNALDSADGNNGTLGTVTDFSLGEVGTAFNFDGMSNYVEVASSANLKVSGPFTIEGWINYHGTPNVYSGDSIVTKGVDAETAAGLGHHGQREQQAEAARQCWRRLALFRLQHGVESRHLVSRGDGVRRGAVARLRKRSAGRLGGRQWRGADDGRRVADRGVCAGQRDGEQGIFPRTDRRVVALQPRAFEQRDRGDLQRRQRGQVSVPPPPPVVPLITSFNPASGAPGTIVEIHGTNFSAIASNNIVYCGAARAIVLASTPSLLDVLVPSGATYAPLTVTVNGLVAASSTPFQPEFPGGSDVTSSSFAPRVDLPAPNGPIFTAIADLDGDGKPDLIVNNAYAHNLSLYRNISTAGSLDTNSFAAPVNFDVAGGDPDNPYGLAVADVDGDGKPDVVICNRLLSLVTVYRNIATPGSLTTASLAPPVSFPVGTDPRHVAVVDLNGDGKPDMVSANYGANTISLLQNIGSAGTLTSNSFMAAVDLPAGSLPYDVAIGDLDGDGKPDLAVTSDSFVLLYRNTGAGGNLGVGTFQSPVQLPSPSGTGIGIALGDLDGDGKPDLVGCTYLSQTMSVFRNQSTPGTLTGASFASRVDFAPGCRGHTVALSDLNGDGKADIGFVGEIPDKFSVYQNVSTPGSFTTGSLAPRVDFPTGYNAWGISIGDLDGDGRPDVVFCNSYDNTISIYRNVMSTGNTTACTPPPFGLVSWWRGGR